MVRYLAKVKEAFQLQTDLADVTDITFDRDLRMDVPVELHRPDGSIVQTKAFRSFLDPPMEDRPICLSFEDLHKEDVPIGTELWLLDSEEAKLLEGK